MAGTEAANNQKKDVIAHVLQAAADWIWFLPMGGGWRE